MKRVISLMLAVVVLGALNACVAPTPLHDIMWVAGSSGTKADFIVKISITLTPGSENTLTDYPHVWTAKGQFEHHQAAETGTIAGTSIRVTPTVAGQTVNCGVLIDGKPLAASTSSARYPKDAVCIGPPV